MSDAGLTRPTLAIWALTAAILCAVSAPAIIGLRFPDPDDAMRLLEVRDWLGGQSWWDVGQHRMNNGDYPMHWSRLVDLPLAAALLVGRLIGTPAFAERFAMTLVPLGTLLVAMAGLAQITRRLVGREEATIALALAPLSIPLLYQLRPMRIDHHGWQIALAIMAMVALIGAPTARRGALAGTCLAALVTISLEGLPITATIAAVLTLAWVLDPERRQQLRAFLAALAGVALALHLVTRGPNFFAPSCDAVSPAWLGAIAIVSAGTVLATFVPTRSVIVRLLVLAPGAVAAVATLALLAPDCVRGPFGGLPPLVRTLWYERVSEGLPLWQQPLDWAIITVAMPITGIVGSIVMLRARAGTQRDGWAFLLAVLVPATILSCLVNRTGATANALAIPGTAYLLVRMLRRTRTIPRVMPRTLATAGALLVCSSGIVAGAVLPFVSAEQVVAGQSSTVPPCERFDQVRALSQLPAGTVFLPIDVAPDLIATTQQHAISGGYHRNPVPLNQVLTAFTATPSDAERIVRSTGATYVAGCPDLNETRLYVAASPNGFWARLQRGERFAWLEPLPIAGSPVLAWRVLPPR